MLILLHAESKQTLHGSFSAVSTSLSASKYALEKGSGSLESSWRDLSDFIKFILLCTSLTAKIQQVFIANFGQKSEAKRYDFLSFFTFFSRKISKNLQFLSRLLLKLGWQSITKKMWVGKEKKENKGRHKKRQQVHSEEGYWLLLDHQEKEGKTKFCRNFTDCPENSSTYRKSEDNHWNVAC